MFSFFYQTALLIYLLFFLPILFYERIFLKKKRKDLLYRLGIKKPKFVRDTSKKLIWIHAVSVGETKAAFFLLEQLKKFYPTSQIVFSTITETGQEEAKRSFSRWVDHFLFLPIDFSFSVNRVLKHFSPDAVFCVETDLWVNFLSCAKKLGAKVFLVSGKISERSFSRYKKFSYFAKKVFENIDTFYVQNAVYKESFSSLGVPDEKLVITGNFKYQNLPKDLSEEEIQLWKKTLCIKDEIVFTIGSTHFPEEEKLLSFLEKILSMKKGVKIFLVPRHPERFLAVEKFLQKKNLAYGLFEKIVEKKPEEEADKDKKIILVNKMGVLPLCFQLSDFAILGGSFVEGIGGHNILEPVFFKKFVFFGPHMEKQEEMKRLVLERGFGREVGLENIFDEVVKFSEKGFEERKAFERGVESFIEEVSLGREKSSAIFKIF